MGARHPAALAVEHVEGSSPPAFKLTRLEDGKSLSPVAIGSPYEFPVEGRPNSPLMRELRWYLEQFLDYPFHPETDHAEHVLDALRAWGTQAFNALFDHRDAGDWLAHSTILQIRADDAHVLSWPWEALYDPQAGAYLAHQRRLERRLNRLPDPQPAADLPNERVNILLVVCRPFEHDVRYRSIARPLIELIQSKNLPAHVDILRPPTFDQLREHLRRHPRYYHVLHFDGHGAYGQSYSSTHQVMGRQGHLIFEDKNGQADPKSAKDIAALLDEHAVPTVVLNACQSASFGEQPEGAFASVATALLQHGIRSVVAMAYSLYVSGAQVFLPAFYRRLFETGSVAEGVRTGRQQMLAHTKRTSPRGPYEFEDWLLPVLYQQAPVDFDFARQAKLETRESRLPKEVAEYREAYGFVGRDSAVLELERAMRDDQPCILVQGLGGVGKTTLARGFLRWLDETGGLDRALWFDFRDIRSAEYVLNRTGEELYGENFGAQKNKLDLLANALCQLRALMVWDNFESAAQNLPACDRDELGRFLDAIRGTRGKVIMTSRSSEPWLTPEWHVRVPREGLGGLDGEERWEYFEIILHQLGVKVNRDDPALSALMDQLAGHPLAMRAVLPRLEKMPAARVSEALRSNMAELGLDETEEQGRLFGTLRFVEHTLPEQLRPMMDLVALHEAYLDTGTFEEMSKLVDPNWTRQFVDRLIEVLANAGLVRDLRDGICEIHPLLTSYLRSRSAASEESQRTFVDIMARRADGQWDHQDLFLVQGANFRSALRLSHHFGMDLHIAALTQALALFARNSRDFVEATRLLTELAQHQAALGARDKEASTYHELGTTALEQADFRSAREWYLRALDIKEGQNLERGPTTFQLGRVAQEQRDFKTAQEWYLKYLAIEENQGNSEGVSEAHHQLGIVASEQHDFNAAREQYLESLAISERQGIPHLIAATSFQLGKVEEDTEGDLKSAQAWYLKSLAIDKNLGKIDEVAMVYNHLGSIAEKHGEFEVAHNYYLSSLAITEKRADLQSAGVTYHELGKLAYKEGDLETARKWYLKALDIREKNSNFHGAAVTQSQLGIIAIKQGNLEEGGKWEIRAIAMLCQSADKNPLPDFVKAFLIVYRAAPSDVMERLNTAWTEAGLGTPPDEIAAHNDSLSDQQVDGIQGFLPRTKGISAQVSVPSTRSIIDSERLIEENVERQHRRAEYARQVAEWEKMPLWKRLGSRRPKAPE